METSMRLLSTYPRTIKLQSPKFVKTRVSVPGLAACFYNTYVRLRHGQLHHQCSSFYVTKPSMLENFKYRNKGSSIRSSVEGSPFDPASNSSNGRTRLIRIILAIQTKVTARINELRKNLPLKILFFLVGFYSATAFATVIGQTVQMMAHWHIPHSGSDALGKTWSLFEGFYMKLQIGRGGSQTLHKGVTTLNSIESQILNSMIETMTGESN